VVSDRTIRPLSTVAQLSPAGTSYPEEGKEQEEQETENQLLQVQIEKVRNLRRKLSMNSEPSRVPGDDELYVGGYVTMIFFLCLPFYIHVISSTTLTIHLPFLPPMPIPSLPSSRAASISELIHQ
jgi:hypothetical protein